VTEQHTPHPVSVLHDQPGQAQTPLTKSQKALKYIQKLQAHKAKKVTQQGTPPTDWGQQLVDNLNRNVLANVPTS
jgi:hypothetical protein